MTAPRITSNIQELKKILKTFRDEAFKETRLRMEQTSLKAWAMLIQRTYANVHRRSGTLARGWVKPAVVGDTFKDLRVVFVNEALYSRIQELGGDIVPKNKQYLAIPLDAALTASGVPRFKSPLDIVPQKGGYTFINKNKVILWSAGGTKKEALKLVPMFVLKKRVELEPRLGARETLQRMLPEFRKNILAGFKKVWRQSNAKSRNK